jgi:hypothetical protein
MGKTSLFSRVALSPNVTVGKKGNDLGGSSVSKNNASINDGDTLAST